MVLAAINHSSLKEGHVHIFIFHTWSCCTKQMIWGTLLEGCKVISSLWIDFCTSPWNTLILFSFRRTLYTHLFPNYYQEGPKLIRNLTDHKAFSYRQVQYMRSCSWPHSWLLSGISNPHLGTSAPCIVCKVVKAPESKTQNPHKPSTCTSLGTSDLQYCPSGASIQLLQHATAQQIQCSATSPGHTCGLSLRCSTRLLWFLFYKPSMTQSTREHGTQAPT